MIVFLLRWSDPEALKVLKTNILLVSQSDSATNSEYQKFLTSKKNLPARLIVESELAACVNIIPQLRSIYKWKGKIEDDKENLLMIKSKYSKVAELTEFIRKNHPYEVCEVITVPVSSLVISRKAWWTLSDSLRSMKTFEMLIQASPISSDHPWQSGLPEMDRRECADQINQPPNSSVVQ